MIMGSMNDYYNEEAIDLRVIAYKHIFLKMEI